MLNDRAEETVDCVPEGRRSAVPPEPIAAKIAAGVVVIRRDVARRAAGAGPIGPADRRIAAEDAVRYSG